MISQDIAGIIGFVMLMAIMFIGLNMVRIGPKTTKRA